MWMLTGLGTHLGAVKWVTDSDRSRGVSPLVSQIALAAVRQMTQKMRQMTLPAGMSGVSARKR
jgi:hypothetical protein